MAKTFLNLLKPDAKLARNGFDLSRKHVFSSSPGLALPCLAVETVPNDYFEIDLASLSRTQTMNTAAFLRGKQRFDFFFVPNSQLWHPFNQFISQRTDKHSANQKGHIYCPVLELGEIVRHIWYTYHYNMVDLFGFPIAEGIIRVLDMLGYGDFRWIIGLDESRAEQIFPFYDGKYVNIFRLAAYQHVWYDYYRNKFYDVEETGGISAFDVDTLFADYVRAFNYDDIACDTFANSILPAGGLTPESQWNNNGKRIQNLLMLRYIPWKMDLFTSALPSQQFGAVSSVDLNNINILNDSSPLTSEWAVVNNSVSSNPSFLGYGTTSFVSSNSFSWSIPSAFDVLSLRKAEALQAWKQNTLRAGQMTDDSFKAHFGVEPYYEGDENVRYLGSFSAALKVNSVEATATTGQSVNGKVGELGATGTIVVDGNKLKFDVKDFGIIMCIASYLPESEYSSNALDKANTLYEQFDYFTPEFQNIGLEPVTLKDQALGRFDTGDFSGIKSTDLNQVIGYAPRYWMYKSAVDKVFGEFKQTYSLVVTDSGGSERDGFYAPGTLSPWVAPREEYVIGTNRSLATFYVSPNVYDNVMGIAYNGGQETDSLIHNVFFDIKAIRPMSVLGLPQF